MSAAAPAKAGPPVPPELLALAANLDSAKRIESDAKAARIKAEEAIIDLLSFELSEGSQTFKLGLELGACTVTLKRPITRSVDTEAWLEARKNLPPSLAKKLMRQSFDLDLKEARELEKDNPDLWRIVAAAVTSKPGKIGVELKELRLMPGFAQPQGTSTDGR